MVYRSRFETRTFKIQTQHIQNFFVKKVLWQGYSVSLTLYTMHTESIQKRYFMIKFELRTCSKLNVICGSGRKSSMCKTKLVWTFAVSKMWCLSTGICSNAVSCRTLRKVRSFVVEPCVWVNLKTGGFLIS
jgi:hypothetical protein